MLSLPVSHQSYVSIFFLVANLLFLFTLFLLRLSNEIQLTLFREFKKERKRVGKGKNAAADITVSDSD